MHGHGHVLVAALTMPAFVRMWSGCQTTKHHTPHPNCLSRGGCEFVHWAAVSALVKHDPSLAPMWGAQAPRWCQRPRPSQSAVPCETLAWQTHSQTLLHSWQGACALCMCTVPSSSSHRFNTSRCCLLACWQASRCCCALCQTCSSTQLGGVHAACVQARGRLQAHAGVCAPSHDHTQNGQRCCCWQCHLGVQQKSALTRCQSVQTAQLHACSRSFITLLVEQHGWQWQTARGLLAISAACGQKHASRWCLCLARFPPRQWCQR